MLFQRLEVKHYQQGVEDASQLALMVVYTPHVHVHVYTCQEW